ncbi:putative DUF4402 domain-containing protein [Candidatus Hepatincolaceae symbiont of Richtersius coronifer]
MNKKLNIFRILLIAFLMILGSLLISLDRIKAETISAMANQTILLKYLVEMTKIGDMSFSSVLFSTVNTTVVTLSSEGSVSINNGRLSGGGSTPAIFTLTGEASSAISLTASGTNLSASSGRGYLTTTYLIDPVIILSSSGSATIKVGASLRIPPTSIRGAYSGRLTVGAHY